MLLSDGRADFAVPGSQCCDGYAGVVEYAKRPVVRHGSAKCLGDRKIERVLHAARRHRKNRRRHFSGWINACKRSSCCGNHVRSVLERIGGSAVKRASHVEQNLLIAGDGAYRDRPLDLHVQRIVDGIVNGSRLRADRGAGRECLRSSSEREVCFCAVRRRYCCQRSTLSSTRSLRSSSLSSMGHTLSRSDPTGLRQN